jgi:asparagine synthetase B (glutamine-hydrolysing)
MQNKRKKSHDIAEKRETYLLKIYRRGGQPGPFIVGTVEEITGRKKAAFKTGEELLRWLDDQAEENRLSF